MLRGIANQFSQNAIVNPEFRVNQRGAANYSFVDSAYSLDRWATYLTPGGGTNPTGTISQQSFTPGQTEVPGEPLNYLRIQNTTQGSSLGAGSYFILAQTIESVRSFAGQSIWVGFWARSSISNKQIGVNLQQLFGTGGSSVVAGNGQSITLGSSWQFYVLPFAIPSISGKTIGTDDGLRFTFWIQSGSTFASQSGGAINYGGNGTIDIANVQVGSTIAPFISRPISDEMALCQRYYEEYQVVLGALSSGTAGYYSTIFFKQTKRRVPVVSQKVISGATNFSLDNFTSYPNVVTLNGTILAAGGYLYSATISASAEY